MQPDELQLKQGEELLGSAKISRTSIVALWLSVPCFAAVILGGFLPWVIRALRMADFIDGHISAFLGGLIAVAVVVLALAWAAVAAVLTKRHVCYSLVVTNLRVVATSHKTQMEASISDLKNVFVEESLGGKIFRYGALTIQAEKGSVTVKNVCDPEALQKQLFDLMGIS